MIENRIFNGLGVRVHTTYGTPPPVGYRFTLEPDGYEYVVTEVILVDSRTFHVIAD